MRIHCTRRQCDRGSTCCPFWQNCLRSSSIGWLVLRLGRVLDAPFVRRLQYPLTRHNAFLETRVPQMLGLGIALRDRVAIWRRVRVLLTRVVYLYLGQRRLRPRHIYRSHVCIVRLPLFDRLGIRAYGVL